MTSIAHIAGVQENTVSSLLTEIGGKCQDFPQTRVHKIDISHLEVDEIWTFVRKKQKWVTDRDPVTVGDPYCFIVIDKDTRPIVVWLLGKRDFDHTFRFAWKIRTAQPVPVMETFCGGSTPSTSKAGRWSLPGLVAMVMLVCFRVSRRTRLSTGPVRSASRVGQLCTGTPSCMVLVSALRALS